MKFTFTLFFILFNVTAVAEIQTDIHDIESNMLEWRRHLHQNPELSNREFKTAAYVENHLKALGLEVKTGIAFTGVVGILKGDKPGPLLALRADMDALPVNEQVDLTFASKVTAEYRGETTGVMHACGHDTHVAILMAVAEVFAKNKADLEGSLMFIFQPAEEGAPGEEEGGAELMLAEGLFNEMKPEAVFGLHVTSSMNTGVVGFRTGPYMAAVDDFELKVIGKQAHGSRPWSGIDPIVTSAQIINSVQTIVSRKTDVTKAPAVVSFGAIKGGIRNNIIPDDVTMVGTIRNFDMGIRDNIHRQLSHIITHVAMANEAEVEFKINEGYPVTINDPELGEKMLPTLKKVFGENQVIDPGLITGAEDFSFFANEVPGLYFFMGVTPKDQDAKTAPTNHSPHFYVDEPALLNGVRAFVQLVEDY
jgi:amidohydrolase